VDVMVRRKVKMGGLRVCRQGGGNAKKMVSGGILPENNVMKNYHYFVTTCGERLEVKRGKKIQ
jgi:hypothetical protein